MLPGLLDDRTPESDEDDMRYWAECRAFFGQFREQYHTTGSILPSSRALGRALTRPLRRSRPPRRILEVGPGTGAVTRAIVRCLKPGDWLDIVEINPKFVRVIEQRFAEEPEFQEKRGQARVIHGPLQDVPGAAVYDFMISGVPLNNFALGLVDDIFESYRRLLKPEGTLSYFEYLAIRDLKMPFVSEDDRQRLQSLSLYLDEKIRAHQIAADEVPFNVPPAIARHLRFS
ncbi:MAG: methyltransferase domain-containing protein [Gemmataceae bacterium]|nr:methyltransferase domain-containing protein [Gemmataceae bacterium]